MKIVTTEDWWEYPVTTYTKASEEQEGSINCIEVDEKIIAALEEARKAESIAYHAFEHAVRMAKIDKAIAEQTEKDFKRAESRSDKHSLLTQNGWKNTSVSMYERDGKELKMHEAFNILKREIEAKLLNGERAKFGAL